MPVKDLRKKEELEAALKGYYEDMGHTELEGTASLIRKRFYWRRWY
jgi:hypothetical protein